MKPTQTHTPGPLAALRHHVTGAIERGEKKPIEAMPAAGEHGTTEIPAIVDEARDAGCSCDVEVIGYLAAEISRLREILIATDAPGLLRACRKDAERIRQLCGMVNDFAGKLGLGTKVHAEDWDDVARAAIARATGQP